MPTPFVPFWRSFVEPSRSGRPRLGELASCQAVAACLKPGSHDKHNNDNNHNDNNKKNILIIIQLTIIIIIIITRRRRRRMARHVYITCRIVRNALQKGNRPLPNLALKAPRLISGDRLFRESSIPRLTRRLAIWSCRHCKPSACILGLTGANTRLSLVLMRISLLIWSSER